MGILYHSELESRILGIKVARSGRLDNFDENALLTEIIEGEYDVCKIKLLSTITDLFVRLDSLNMPYVINSLIVRSEVEITKSDSQANFELQFELFDGVKADVLKNLVKEIVANNTATNYTNTDLGKIISYESELEASAEYALGFNHLEDAGKKNWLIKMNSEYIGFVLGEINDDTFEGKLYGIIPAYRGENYSCEIMRFLKNMCFEEGLKYFTNDVVFQNVSSLKNILAESLNPIQSYIHVNINSLFSTSQSPKNKIEISVKGNDRQFLMENVFCHSGNSRVS